MRDAHQYRYWRESRVYINSILAVIYVNKQVFQKLINRPEMNCRVYINSILAVIYLTKLQNLINHPVMNCRVYILSY
jgi:hypothetical protein